MHCPSCSAENLPTAKFCVQRNAAFQTARVLQRQCKRDEALTMLAQIYNWSTESFDTADLKDAKALLDQLSG